MLGQLVKKELLDHFMSLRFAAACTLCLIVVLTMVCVRCADYSQVLDDYHQESAMSKHEMDTWDNPMEIIYGGVPVHRQPNPLKIFIRGTESSNGGLVMVNSNEPLRFSLPDLQNKIVPLFTSVDMVAFVGIIMSLLAIIFGYDSVCGEKQRGTLRLLLSYSIPRDQVLIAKWIGGYVMLVLPLILALIAGVVIVLSRGDVSFSGGQWLRYLCIVGLGLLFVAVFYSLSILVSCLTAHPGTSVMLLVTLWVILVLGIPSLSPHLAAVWYPSQEARNIDKTRQDASKEIWARMVDEPLTAYRKTHAWNFDTIRYVYNCVCNGRLARLEEYRKISERCDQSLEVPRSLSRWMAQVSPFGAFAIAAAELADAGWTDKRRFLSQAGEYQKVLCSYAYDERIVLKCYELTGGFKPQNVPSWVTTKVKPIPTFQYQPPAAREYLQNVTPNVAILCVMVVGLFLGSYLAFLRYDVR